MLFCGVFWNSVAPFLSTRSLIYFRPITLSPSITLLMYIRVLSGFELPWVTGCPTWSFSFVCLFVFDATPQWTRASLFTRFLDHTQRRTTVVRTPVDEWLTLRRDLYLTTHNTHNRQASVPPLGFEPTVLGGELPQTYALERAAVRTAKFLVVCLIFPIQYWVYSLQLLQLLPFRHLIFLIRCLRGNRQYAKKFKSCIISIKGKTVIL